MAVTFPVVSERLLIVTSSSGSMALNEHNEPAAVHLLICRLDRNALGYPLARGYFWHRYEEDVVDSLQYGPSTSPRLRDRSSWFAGQRHIYPQRV